MRRSARELVSWALTAAVLSVGVAAISAAPALAAGITSTIGGFNSPQGVAVLPDGSAAYVVDSANNAIKVIDTATNTVTTTISLNGGSPAYTSPQGITISPDGAYAYVTANGPLTPSSTTDGILTIATSTNTVTAWSRPGLTTRAGLSINPAGTRLYLAQANNNAGTVRVVQISDMTIVSTITNLNNSSGCNGTGWISGTAVSNDGTKLYVACNGTGKVLVLNLSDNSVANVITGFTNPNSIAVASDGTIHVTDQSTGVSSVTILDGTSYSVLSTVTGFNRPTGIALTPNNQRAYVANSNNAPNGGADANSVSAVSRTYAVSYNGNSSTSGTAPTAGTYTTGGTAYSVSGNTGSLARTGYTFSGWNTAANGTGTTYAAGSSTYSTAATATLYAQWTGISYNVTYDGNGSTGGAAPSAGSYTSGGSAYTVPSNGTLAKTGYTFTGWNTLANGSGTTYGPGTAHTTYSTSADQLLYAQWAAGTYSITFDDNGSTSGTVPSAGSFTTGGGAYNVAGNSGTLARTGYTFAGWNTLANGSGTDYAAGSSTISPSANTTLYAKWTGVTYHITFDDNGSTGGAAPSSGTYVNGGTAYAVPGNGTLTNSGYAFNGWNTAANGSGTAYGPGTAHTTYSSAADQLLYAQWATGTYTISFDGNGFDGGSVPANGSYTTGGAAYSVPGNTGALVKSGSSFSGWNTVANGTGTAYAAGASTMSPTTNVILYAQWTATSSGSGSGGGGTSSPTTTTTASLPSTVRIPSLDPITHDANPRIPSPGSALGSSVILTSIGSTGTSSQSLNVRFTVDAGRVETPDFTLALTSRYARARETPGTPGALTLYSRAGASPRSLSLATTPEADPTLDTSGSGFQPGSPIRVYLLPSTRLGDITADASGGFSGHLPVPSGLAPGAQTLQINGFAPDGSVRSLSIGVVVKSISTEPVVQLARASVQFARGSAYLTRSGKAQLTALVKRTGRSGAMSVVGFARGQKLTTSAKALSDARARAVASYLRRLGLRGTYTVRGVWVVGGPVSTGERVTVVVSYPTATSHA